MPASLANRIARLGVDVMIPNIILIAEHAGRAPEEVAPVFFDVSSTFRIGRIDALAQDLHISDYYDGLALDRARSTLAAAHRRITADVLKSADGRLREPPSNRQWTTGSPQGAKTSPARRAP